MNPFPYFFHNWKTTQPDPKEEYIECEECRWEASYKCVKCQIALCSEHAQRHILARHEVKMLRVDHEISQQQPQLSKRQKRQRRNSISQSRKRAG